MVQADVLRSLASLKVLPLNQLPSDWRVSQMIAGAERNLTTHTLETATDETGGRYAAIRSNTRAPKPSSGIVLRTDSHPDR